MTQTTDKHRHPSGGRGSWQPSLLRLGRPVCFGTPRAPSLPGGAMDSYGPREPDLAPPTAANGQQRPPTVASNGRPQRALAARERRRPRPAPQPPLSASPRASRCCPLGGRGHGPGCPGCGFPSRNGRAEPWQRRGSGAPLRAPRRRAALLGVAIGGCEGERVPAGSALSVASPLLWLSQGVWVRLFMAPVSERIGKLRRGGRSLRSGCAVCRAGGEQGAAARCA